MVFENDYPDVQVHIVESREEASESDSVLKFVISQNSTYKACWVSRPDNKTLCSVIIPITGDHTVEIHKDYETVINSYKKILGMLSHLPGVAPGFITSDECRWLTTMILCRTLRIIEGDVEHKSLILDVEIQYDTTCVLEEVVVDEGDDHMRMIEEYEIMDNGLLPASESSMVDLMERDAMIVGDDDQRNSCSICLEEFTQMSLEPTMDDDCSHAFRHKCNIK